MKHTLKGLLTLIFAGTLAVSVHAQQNVGIGTLNPHSKAMLDVQATDKGFLLPRMTTLQRTAIGASGAADAGLVVYDTNDNRFYFWNGTAWNYFPQQPGDDGWIVSGTNVYSSASGNVGIGITNPSAKLHVLGTVRLANVGATTTNIEVLTVDGNGNVRTRELPSDIWDGDSVDDADSDPDNECVTSVFYNSGTNAISLIDCGVTRTTGPLPFNANDNDSDASNELQTINSASGSGTVTLTLSPGGSNTNFSINDADANPTNEAQTLAITKTGTSVAWNLGSVSGVGGGSGSFSVDDEDWDGAGTGEMYPATLTDNVGIGNNNPAHKLDVTGNIMTSDKLYLKSTSYYATSIDTSLQLFSNTNIKLQTNTGHLTTYDHSGSEAFINHNLDGQNVMTLRGNGSYAYAVGIGTQTPSSKLHVAGDTRIGAINPSGFTNGGNNFGSLLYLSGGPASGGFNSDNDDLLYLARYNSAADESELRIGIGDDASQSSGTDRLSIGSYTSSDVTNFTGLFDFEVESPGSSDGPLLSISPGSTLPAKTYNGGLAITKPIGLNGQYINLARGNLTVWSIGYQYGTNRFAIHEGNTNDAAFATTPHFTIIPGGNIGLGVASPVYQLELSSNSAGKPGSNTWTITSDERLKKDIKPFHDGLSLVKQINPVTFRYNGKAGMPADEEFVGIIAQDIRKVAPYMVGEWQYETKEGAAEKYLSYDGNAMTYILINAIKEQQQQIEELQKQNALMISEMRELKAGGSTAEK